MSPSAHKRSGGIPLIGKTVAHYRIQEKIGAGGMGDVYRAQDLKLGRDVAIKTLPEALARDAQRMSRFRNEARVLASLNHPGIATVHGIEETEGTAFLVMELVEGEDLSERLARGPMTPRETIEVMSQVARALEEAHARGIVHRDLKPANIKVSSRGRVKVLDFGLAKAVEAGKPELNATLPLTMAGTVLGTAAYMSPEQARGLATDFRSDIWSFGCVLWECLTGKILFAGKTPSDSMTAVLNSDPDWSELPPRVPGNLRRVLRRCLVKEVDERLQHITDGRIELEDTADDPAKDGDAGNTTRSTKRYRVAIAALGIALMGTATALFLDHSRKPVIGENFLDSARFTRLTNFPGDEFEADISPDGRFVTFVSDRDGPFDILVGQIGSGVFRNVTRNLRKALLQDVRAPVRSVGFTRDGSGLWFGGGTGRRLQAVSLLGGPVRNLLGEDVVNLDWSPDGSRIAYHLRTAGDPLYVADSDGTNAALILPSKEGTHQHYPTWSPDGEWIYLVRGRVNTQDTNLWRLRPDGSGLEQLTRNMRNVTYPTPIDARTVLFCAEELDGAGPWLWSFDLETRESRRATFGLEHYTSVAASNDGTRLVATVENPRASLWRVPILDRVATEEDVEPVEVPNVRALVPRLSGERLFYLSSQGSGDGLWVFQDGESREIWRGAEAPLLEAPAVSPNGDAIAVVCRVGSMQRLFVLTADGAERRTLTDALDVTGSISWSPDGRWIAAGGSTQEGSGLFKVPVDGGAPQRIIDGEVLSPVWSPRGDLIVYTGPQVQAVAPLLGVTPNGDAVELPDILLLREWGGERMRFMPDGSGLVYMKGLSPSMDFWLLDLATMETRPLTKLDGTATMYTFDVAPDGSGIVFDRLRQSSDLVLVELAASDR